MIDQISVEDLRNLTVTADPVVIDVREQAEYDGGHLPGAKWIPMALVPLRQEAFSAQAPAYVVCRTGNRSGQVVMWLAQRGIPAVNVAGGTEAWHRLGFPLQSGSQAGSLEGTLQS